MEPGERIDALAEKMAKQLRLKGGGSFGEVVEKAGRRLPGSIKADVAVLTEAETMLGHPKLGRLVDEKKLAKAEKRIAAFLDDQNPDLERWHAFLDGLAKIAFVFVVVVLGVFFFMLWRGML